MTAVVIQARMGSKRLPGKVLLPIGGIPAIVHTYRRCQKAFPTVVAVPRNARNQPLLKQLHQHRCDMVVTYIEENDVLGRYHHAAKTLNADRIVRITGDCPFIDPYVIEHVASHDAPYVSNTIRRTWPRGLDVEVFSRDLLEDAHNYATEPYDREHVTPWMQRNSEVKSVERRDDLSAYRWCLDDSEDYLWFQSLVGELDTTPPRPETSEILALLALRPDLIRKDTA